MSDDTIQSGMGDFETWALQNLGMETKITASHAGGEWTLEVTGTGRGTDGFSFDATGKTLKDAIAEARRLGEELIA